MADNFQRITKNTVINDYPIKEGNECSEIVLSDSEGRSSKRQRLSSHPSSSAVSSGDSPYSDSSSNDCLMKHTIKKVTPNKLTPDVWEDVSAIKCASLLPDIDGTSVCEFLFCPCNGMKSSADGRKWKRYMSSKRFGFT